MARTGCGYTEPSPFHSSTAGTYKACHHSRLYEGETGCPPGAGFYELRHSKLKVLRPFYVSSNCIAIDRSH